MRKYKLQIKTVNLNEIIFMDQFCVQWTFYFLRKWVVWLALLLVCNIRYKSELNFFNFQHPPPPKSNFNQNPLMSSVRRSVDDHIVELSFDALLSFWGNNVHHCASQLVVQEVRLFQVYNCLCDITESIWRNSVTNDNLFLLTMLYAATSLYASKF
jgi:hypothetical protein